MDIRPIISTLARHKISASLIVLEITLTCAILCNAIDIIASRVEQLQRQTGWAENELVVIALRSLASHDGSEALTRQDLQTLRGIPGVKAATVVNQVPYGGSSWNTNVQVAPDLHRTSLSASQYLVVEHFLEVSGVRLIAGRDFASDEFVDGSATEDDSNRTISVLINQPMAVQLFPDGQAIGKTIYQSTQPLKIVGIVQPMSAARQLSSDYPAIVLPVRMSFVDGEYLLRVDPARRERIVTAAVDALQRLDPQRLVLKQRSMIEMKDRFFATHRALCWLLVATCAALLTVTAAGIVGLGSFWVQQRTRMIGTRRALGATRAQIFFYFQIENLLLTAVGVLLGMLAAYSINQLFMTQYELGRLSWRYLPLGALVLFVLGQIAVLGPALRAAAVPPAMVMRDI